MRKIVALFVFALLVGVLCMTSGNSARAEAANSHGQSDGADEKLDIGNTTTFAWMHDLEKARAKAKREKKPLFVMFRCEP